MSYRVRGVPGIRRMLNKLDQRGNTIVKSIIQVTAHEIAGDAKSKLQSASKDYSKIAQSISVWQESDFKWNVGVNELPIGAYVEFGTGVYVEVPEGWEDIAMTFYVNGKGWTEPHPYLIPAFYKGEEQFNRDIRDAFQHLVNQFNRG